MMLKMQIETFFMTHPVLVLSLDEAKAQVTGCKRDKKSFGGAEAH